MIDLPYKIDDHVDLSLRLWSDDLALSDLIDRLGLTVGVLHVVGAPIADEGPLSARRARRHFASTAERLVTNDSDVNEWISNLIGALITRSGLQWLERISKGQIEAVFWVTVLGASFRLPPVINPINIAMSKALGLGVFVENYTSETQDLPTKTWVANRVGNRLAEAG